MQISTPDMFTPPEDLLNSSDHIWHGAAIMWHTSLNSHITNLKTKNTRFTSIRISVQDQKLVAISVYFPTSGKDDEFVDCTVELINFVNEVKKSDESVSQETASF